MISTLSEKHLRTLASFEGLTREEFREVQIQAQKLDQRLQRIHSETTIYRLSMAPKRYRVSITRTAPELTLPKIDQTFSDNRYDKNSTDFSIDYIRPLEETGLLDRDTTESMSNPHW
jgi:hypothetical protein